jgi:hypothetical protein
MSLGSVTFSGLSTDVWIIQVDSSLDIAANTKVILSGPAGVPLPEGGAQAKNIFWAVSGSVTLNKASHFEGIINTYTNVAVATSASLNGRILAGTAVTLQMNTITQPKK